MGVHDRRIECIAKREMLTKVTTEICTHNGHVLFSCTPLFDIVSSDWLFACATLLNRAVCSFYQLVELYLASVTIRYWHEIP
jgi:hypothetical protein